MATYSRLLKVTSPLMSGEDVRAVQNKLNSLGFSAGTADGLYGNGTKEAVIRFQKSKGLSADGIVGNATWSKLFGSTPSGGGNDLGTRIYVNSSKGNHFTLSAHTGGDYNHDYRMYSHGPGKGSDSKIWYKDTLWATNSTKEIKVGIEGMNKCFDNLQSALSTPGAGDIALKIVTAISVSFGTYITPGLTKSEMSNIVMNLGVLAAFVDVVAVTMAAREYAYYYANTVIHWNKV